MRVNEERRAARKIARAAFLERGQSDRSRAIGKMTRNARRAWYGSGPLKGKVAELDWSIELGKWAAFWGQAKTFT